MKPNQMFNKMNHQSNEDEEKLEDAQHAALAKMMQGSPEASAPTPPPAVAAPAAVPPAAPIGQKPVFPGIHAALRPPKPAATIKVASIPKKPKF